MNIKIITIGTIALSVSSSFVLVSCSNNTNITKDYKGKPIKALGPESVAKLKSIYPEYYSSLNNDMKGEDLFNALQNIQKKYKQRIGSYGELWNIYKSAFIDKYDEKDGTIYDVYSEIIDGPDDFNFTPGADQDRGGGSSPGEHYNREHLIPQSIFGGNVKYIHNDAHFVFPADKKINGLRSNFVHDNVDAPSKTGEKIGGNNWKFGTGSNGQTAFEPDDNFKGDIARAYMYFSLTWGNYSKKVPYDVFGDSFNEIKENYLKVYLKWSDADPVDQFDIDRNNEIAKFEGGLRNPLIDMPKLINLIWE